MTQKNQALDADYFIGLISSLLSLGLIIFTLYILPVLLFGLKYSIPGFLLVLREYFASELDISDKGAAGLIVLLLIVCIGLLGYIACRYETQIEEKEIIEETGEPIEAKHNEYTQHEHIETEVDRAVPEPPPHFATLMVLLAAGIVVSILFLHWIISI